MDLRGVGPVIAERIVRYRRERPGGFRSVAELAQVEGLSDAATRRIARRGRYMVTNFNQIRQCSESIH